MFACVHMNNHLYVATFFTVVTCCSMWLLLLLFNVRACQRTSFYNIAGCSFLLLLFRMHQRKLYFHDVIAIWQLNCCIHIHIHTYITPLRLPTRCLLLLLHIFRSACALQRIVAVALRRYLALHSPLNNVFNQSCWFLITLRAINHFLAYILYFCCCCFGLVMGINGFS